MHCRVPVFIYSYGATTDENGIATTKTADPSEQNIVRRLQAIQNCLELLFFQAGSKKDSYL